MGGNSKGIDEQRDRKKDTDGSNESVGIRQIAKRAKNLLDDGFTCFDAAAQAEVVELGLFIGWLFFFFKGKTNRGNKGIPNPWRRMCSFTWYVYVWVCGWGREVDG